MNEPEPSAPTTPLTPLSLEYYRDPRVLRLIGCTIGLMGFFIMYGILQERIMTVPFDEEGTMFTNSAFLVLNNRVVAALCALFILYYRGEEIRPAAPIWKFSGISISNSLATLCQYEALKYISFPTQTLGKCGKMIPVMIVGTIISGKRYSLKDYGAAFSHLDVSYFFFLGTLEVVIHPNQILLGDYFWSQVIFFAMDLQAPSKKSSSKDTPCPRTIKCCT